MKTLKLKYSKWLPIKGFYAISLFGYIVRREKYRDTYLVPHIRNHENVHLAQAYDFGIGFCGWFIFYILYILEWLLKVICALFTIFKVKAYKSISFEQEAYNNEWNIDYIRTRKRFAWAKYILHFEKEFR